MHIYICLILVSVCEKLYNKICNRNFSFWAVKRFAYAIELLSVLSCPVCNVGLLWPNGWMD